MRYNLKVDVVLTAYKKIDVLQRQINAIREQTYKINKLYLFKDGIDSYYDIVLNDFILKQFDGVKVAECNVGVWGRFEYAYNTCESEMICLFDDDTIPGNRWIENCVECYLEKKGIYGTNGILVKEAQSYPYDMINVGWHNPNKETIKVDFVGHSWFLKKEWLQWMLELREKNECKYVGEDMALSFACQKRGIYTYVPPHPYADVRLWGSKPTEGRLYGTQGSAVSLNSANLDAMNKAIINFYRLGWKFLLEDETYYEKIKDNFEGEMSKSEVIKEDLLKYVQDSPDIYLYGAGKYGKIFYDFFKEHNKVIKAFVVTEPKDSHVRFGNEILEIISLEQLNKLKKAKVILSLNSIHHYCIRRKIDKRISVFSEEETSYNYDDIIEAIQ